MPKFRKILCPIAFDNSPKAALEIACELAEARGATVHLLHVAKVPTPDMDVPLPFNADPKMGAIREDQARTDRP